MPLFEYECRKCGHEFERLVGSLERERSQPCPKCKAKESKKRISRTSFLLKGGGWASDGYAG